MTNIIDFRDASVRMLARAAKPRLVFVQATPVARRTPHVMSWARDPVDGILVATWSVAANDAGKARPPGSLLSRLRRGSAPPRRERIRYGRRV